MKLHLLIVAGLTAAVLMTGAPVTGGTDSVVGPVLPIRPGVVGSQATGESIIQTTVPGQPTRFAFGAGDGFPDSVVQLTLSGQCTIKITRIPVTPADILNRCEDDAFANSPPVIELRNPMGGSGREQVSVYRIEPQSECSESAFPAQIEIFYFGVAERVGDTTAFRTRMIHAPTPPAEGNCQDVSIDVTVPKDPTDLDPRVGGAEDDFSDFFLVNVRDAGLSDPDRITARYGQLISLTRQFFPSQEGAVVSSQWAFINAVIYVNEGDIPNAREQFREAVQLLRAYLAAVVEARNGDVLSPSQAKRLQVLAPQIVFAVRQYSALKKAE